MSQLKLIDAACQIEQAQAVLSMWLESTTNKTNPDLPRLGDRFASMYSISWRRKAASQKNNISSHA